MYQAHRVTKPSAIRVALRLAGHFVASLIALVALWGGLVAFLLIASVL